MTQIQTAEQVGIERQAAETLFDSAKAAADALRAQHAAAELREAFPRHEVAIFGRNWDEDRPVFKQLLSALDDVDDIELSDDTAWERLSREQKRAIGIATRTLPLIGSDDEIHRYLGQGGELHDDWVEFVLPLNPATPESE